MTLFLRYAWRELRGGGLASLRQFRIVLACLALGVGAIALVGTLRASLTRGLAEQGTALLGGDLAIDGNADPFPAELWAFLAARGARVSEVVRLSSLMAAPDGERTLISLQAVDGGYPLKGVVKLSPVMEMGEALRAHGVVAQDVVFGRLGLKAGSSVKIGDATFRLSAVLVSQPDSAINLGLFGPSVLISTSDLASTGLLAPGAMIDRSLRVSLPAGMDPARVAAQIKRRFADQGYRVRTRADGTPGVDRTIDQVANFLTLVGLASLLVGGIGVAVGIEAWLVARARSIAILRCLGASANLILAIYLAQSLALAALGIIAGLVIGGVVPWLAGDWLASLLPVPAHFGIYPAPLGLAAFYGLVTTLVFSLAPLGRATRLSGADLFRDSVMPSRLAPRSALMLVIGALVVLLVFVAVRTSHAPGLALGFAISSLVTLLLFRVAGGVLTRLAAGLPRPRNIALRLGIGALHRPGADTSIMLVALGLGLTSLAAIVCTEANLRAVIADQMPVEAPSFYFIDIQPAQLDQFHSIVSGFSSVRDVTEVPNLRARIVAVRGIPAEKFADNPQAGWAVRGDRGLTYAAEPPPGTELVSGKWWPADYDGPPLLSLDADLARGLGVRVGDVIRVNVLGRQIDLTIASTRRIAWRSLSMNYALVASPGMLAGAPHTNIATLRSDPAQDGAILRAVATALPNVTGIRVADILATVSALIRKLASALAATGAIGLVSGGLVLAGAIAAGQQRRAREAVILKTLGATSGQIRLAFLVEFGLIGIAGGIMAGLIGSLASYAVITWVMHEDWRFTPAPLAATLLISIMVTLLFGLLSTSGALQAKPASFLRNE